jgi:serine/threonine-protein kinase
MSDKTEAFGAAPTPASNGSADTDGMRDLTGKTFGDFHILRRLGQGGMGQVYLAEQVSLKRNVALKFLKPELAANKTSLARFEQEAKAIARVTHANIVHIHQVGEIEGMHFMSLEYVEGKNLREFIEKKGPPEVKVGLKIMSQVAAAIQHASELGIVHRDIKPENILINRKAEVKVTDFGLSRHFKQDSSLTESRIAMGTPLYMSPEQVEGKPVDHRTDIYSFGVSCYHLFAGAPPFKGESPFEVALQHVQKEPTPLSELRPDLPIDLCRIIHRMMAKDPAQRYQTGREIVRDVGRLRDALVATGGTLASPILSGLTPSGTILPLHTTNGTETLSGSQTLRVRRGGHPWVLAGLTTCCVGVGLLVGWWLTPPPVVAVPTATNPEGKREEPPAAIKELFSPKEREKELVRKVNEYLKLPITDERIQGMEPVLDLGTLYLREQRFVEADKFFTDITPPAADKKTPFRLVAQLGHAAVLAHRDQPAESVKLYRETLDKLEQMEKILAKARESKLLKLPDTKKDKTTRTAFLHSWEKHVGWREQMSIALQRDYDNAPKDFPNDPRLELLRQPPGPGAKALAVLP